MREGDGDEARTKWSTNEMEHEQDGNRSWRMKRDSENEEEE